VFVAQQEREFTVEWLGAFEAESMGELGLRRSSTAVARTRLSNSWVMPVMYMASEMPRTLRLQ